MTVSIAAGLPDWEQPARRTGPMHADARMRALLSQNLFPIVFSRNGISEMEKRNGPAFPKWPVSGSHVDRLNGEGWARAADLGIVPRPPQFLPFPRPDADNETAPSFISMRNGALQPTAGD
ncbi:hypothetical protein, partial [Novosphingobium sp. AAP1]|uniref:hypothetical protein n=1 Tax=Novosphingobium sp. AAP1 TaxID=1523413 RepID=UPI001E292F9D